MPVLGLAGRHTHALIAKNGFHLFVLVLGLVGRHTHALIAKNWFYLFVPVLGLASGHCREIDTAENGFKKAGTQS